MLAEPIGAAAALGLGLLTSVVPDDELPAAAAALAARLAAGPTLAYAAIKERKHPVQRHPTSSSESLEKKPGPAVEGSARRRITAQPHWPS